MIFTISFPACLGNLLYYNVALIKNVSYVTDLCHSAFLLRLATDGLYRNRPGPGMGHRLVRMTRPGIHMENLTAGYDRRPAIHHLNASIDPGSLIAVIGPNGGGKSTLLKTLMGLLVPMSGSYHLSSASSIAYLPQISEVDRSFPITVFDTVLMGAWPRSGFFRFVSGEIRKRAFLALEQVGMQAFAQQSIAALSIGQFQRVLFARLLLQDTKIYLLDEPLSAIDQRTCADLLKIIGEWHRLGKIVLCVLHDMEQVRHHFPQTMLLARELIGFGETSEILCTAKLDQARRRAEEWHDHADECAIEPMVFS